MTWHERQNSVDFDFSIWRFKPVAVTRTGSTRKARNASTRPPRAAVSEGRSTTSAMSARVTAVASATVRKPAPVEVIEALLPGLLEPIDHRAELRVRPLPLLAVLLAVHHLFLLEELGEERL